MNNTVSTSLQTQPYVDTAKPKSAKKILKDWNIGVPPDQFEPLTLLTIMGVAVTALWTGELGEHYIAWCRPESIALCGQLH